MVNQHYYRSCIKFELGEVKDVMEHMLRDGSDVKAEILSDIYRGEDRYTII